MRFCGGVVSLGGGVRVGSWRWETCCCRLEVCCWGGGGGAGARSSPKDRVHQGRYARGMETRGRAANICSLPTV